MARREALNGPATDWEAAVRNLSAYERAVWRSLSQKVGPGVAIELIVRNRAKPEGART